MIDTPYKICHHCNGSRTMYLNGFDAPCSTCKGFGYVAIHSYVPCETSLHNEVIAEAEVKNTSTVIPSSDSLKKLSDSPSKTLTGTVHFDMPLRLTPKALASLPDASRIQAAPAYIDEDIAVEAGEVIDVKKLSDMRLKKRVSTRGRKPKQKQKDSNEEQTNSER